MKQVSSICCRDQGCKTLLGRLGNIYDNIYNICIMYTILLCILYSNQSRKIKTSHVYCLAADDLIWSTLYNIVLVSAGCRYSARYLVLNKYWDMEKVSSDDLKATLKVVWRFIQSNRWGERKMGAGRRIWWFPSLHLQSTVYILLTAPS